MTIDDVNEAIRRISTLSPEMQYEWVLALGANLTVCSRAAYPASGSTGDIQQLVAMNEMQHRVFGYLRKDTSENWTVDSFATSLVEMADAYGVVSQLRWAVQRASAIVDRVR